MAASTNLGHGHAHQLAELGLVVGGDVDGFHGSVLLLLSQRRGSYVPVTTPPSTLITAPRDEDASSDASQT